ncbi:carnosine synthase 1-like [Amphiura filiformis]|uniref:carnosine synthase 1-like n=1 Tax=Amphiura filiformis TaxID=82378 RepID=UPI003B2234AE
MKSIVVPNTDVIKVCVLGKCVKAKKQGEVPRSEKCLRVSSCRIEDQAKMAAQTNAENPCVYTKKQIEHGGICEHAIAMEEEVAKFLNKPSVIGKRIVVKPSGYEYFASKGVTIHQAGNLGSITNAVYDLIEKIKGADTVLVETFVEPILPRPIVSGSQLVELWKANEELSFRVRSTVCRDFDGMPVTTSVNCGLLSKDSLNNGDNTNLQGLDSTLLAYGLTDPAVRRNLDRTIRKKGEDVMRIISEEEHKLDEDQRGGRFGYTDVIGVDFFLTDEGDKIVPVVIEVNSHDCTMNCQKVDFVSHMTQQCTPIDAQLVYQVYRSDKEYGSETLLKQDSILGRSVRPWVRSMIQRSQDHVFDGKHILIIGAGGFSNAFIWLDAAAMGVKVILVESNSNHFAKDQVYQFIYLDVEDHTQDRAHAKDIVKILRDKGITVDGCLAFCKDCGPLAALCAELLKTNGASYSAASIASKKSSTQAIIRQRDADIPHWQIANLYCAASCPISSEADIDNACKTVKFPAIFKHDYASSAVSARICKDEDDVRTAYTAITNNVHTNADTYGIGVGNSNTILLMDYLDGSEHHIDCVVFERRLIAAFITDNGRNNNPAYTDTITLLPSNLPSDKQGQLVNAAYQCCTVIGLSNGVYNVEMKMTSTGPKLIEINAQMGSLYIRNWVKQLYGVDLMKCAMMISCGIKPCVPILPTAESLLGINLIPSEHVCVMTNSSLRMVLDDLRARGDVIFTMIEDEAKLEYKVKSKRYEEPYANIAVKGRNVDECRQKLSEVCGKLNIETKNYRVSVFMKYL